MSMKAKDKYKKSGSADRRFCGLRLFHDRWCGPRYTKIEGTKRQCL